jgi:hypothetical protein
MRRNLLVIACCVLSAHAALADDAPAPATSAPSDPSIETTDSKANWKELSGLVGAMLDKDPIGRIANRMGKSADLLGKFTTDQPTQTVQKNIIVGLDEFIAMLEKRKKKGKSGSGGPDPLPDSILAKGPGGEGDMRDPNASARLWGQLPPNQREQILQSQTQGFPAGYEAILSNYYKRLALENVQESVPAPSTRPAQPR